MESTFRILSFMKGYCCASTAEISTLNEAVEIAGTTTLSAPFWVTPIRSIVGASPAMASREAPFHFISFHVFAGPTTGEVIYPRLSVEGGAADVTIAS